jgi:glucose/arabinose dehydrogenase
MRRYAGVALHILLQLLLVTLAVYGVSRTVKRFSLLIGPLRGSKNPPLDLHDVGRILVVMLIVHAALYAASAFRYRRHGFTDPARFLAEIYVALVATSLGACWLFVMTIVPFGPNFYAQLYLALTALYAATYLVLGRFRRRPAEGPKISAVDLSKRLVSPAFIAATLVILLPGVLAVVYKKSETFANSVNSVRARFNVETESFWTLTPVMPGTYFEQPMSVAFDQQVPDRFYVLSRPGRVHRYDRKGGEPELLLDLSSEVGSIDAELGALSVALHPRFGHSDAKERGYAYVFYTTFANGEQANRLTRFDLSLPDLGARNGSRLVLIEQRRPATGQHNGGTVFFGPEGFLYVTIGDFQRRWAQTIHERFSGGVLRIDVDQRGGEVSGPVKKQPVDGATTGYFIPKDNPWYEHPDALGEFWAIGFRNPFRAWLNPADGSVWLGDVGEDRYEEVNRVERGDNGQWPYREGPLDTGREKPQPLLGRELAPIYAYHQTALDRVVLAGPLYTGNQLPGLKGKLIMADNNSSTVFAVDLKQTQPKMKPIARAERLGQQGITAVMETPDGKIWITVLGAKSESSGLILELTAASGPGASAAPAQPPGNTVDYKFEAVCSRCHGSDGRGNPQLAALKARPDFTSHDWQTRTSDAKIRDVIAKGGAALGMSGDMPAWAGFLNDEELDLMVKKIRQIGASTAAAKPR